MTAAQTALRVASAPLSSTGRCKHTSGTFASHPCAVASAAIHNGHRADPLLLDNTNEGDVSPAVQHILHASTRGISRTSGRKSIELGGQLDQYGRPSRASDAQHVQGKLGNRQDEHGLDAFATGLE